MLPLAELPAPDSAAGIGWLLLGLAALAVAVNSILSIVDRLKKKEASGTEIVGQPLEVRPSPEYVRREEFTQLSARVIHLEAKFDEAVQTLSEHGEDRARRLHARIDMVLAAVGQTNSAVARVEGQLERLPCDRCSG